MSSKKRKIDDEHHVMQENLKTLYFFDEVKGKPACLICMQNVAAVKAYNIRRHYTSKHASIYDKFSGKFRDKKFKELQKSL